MCFQKQRMVVRAMQTGLLFISGCIIELKMIQYYVIFVITSLSKVTLKQYLVKGFITNGFRNWKNALEKIRGHEASECHMIALEHISKKRDIVEMNTI